MEFRCRLGTEGGEILEEVHTSESEADLRQYLEGQGLYILSLQRRGFSSWSKLPFRYSTRVRTREFLVFNQELATLLGAGLPLVQSLDILRDKVDDGALKSLLDDVYLRVRAGSALSEAFEAQGDEVSGVYTASLLAGEKSGGLEEVLHQYVGYVRIIAALKQKSISALVYPAVLLGLSLIVVAIVVLRVVPQFEGFYQGFGTELPLMTQLIVRLSEFLRSQFWFFLLGTGGLGAIGWHWMRQPGRQILLDKWLLSVPAIGAIARRFATSQLSRTLSVLLGGGIPLVDSIEVASKALGNRYYGEQLLVVGQKVREGQAFARALSEREVFPSVAIKMVEVGESTGALREMLGSVADFFDEEIDTQLGRLITLIEPALLVIMGIIIAALLVALYLPLLQLGSVLS